MVKPQQPELRRSDLGATSDDATKARLTAPPAAPGSDGRPGGPVPEENLPGHHPEQDQDKPSGEAFVAKMHELAVDAAQEEADQAAGAEQERGEQDRRPDIDLSEREQRQRDSDVPSDRAERLAALAGKPFAAAGAVLKGVRDRLPGD
jgi:hypothetical protein